MLVLRLNSLINMCWIKPIVKQPNLYEILHVGQNAPVEVIKAAYKGLANIYHPDKYKGADANEKMNQIRQAYETLTDEHKRAAYDALQKKILESENNASANKNWPPKLDSNLPPKLDPNYINPNQKKNPPPRDVNIRQQKLNISEFIWIIFIGVIAGACLYVDYYDNPRQAVLNTSEQNTNASHVTEAEQELPSTGTNNASFNNGVAPLNIKTSSAGGYHYFIKLINTATHEELGSYFIRSGDTLNITVPAGSYELKYASGRTWYGENHLFGPETNYNKADSIFNFSFDGYQYSGYTIELIMQQNGNLQTSGLQPNQW